MKLIEKLKGAHERSYVAYKILGYYSSYQEAKVALCHSVRCVIPIIVII